MIMQNPFNETDIDRRYMWEMLVKRDIEAFLKEDWSMVANDFIAEGFIGIDGCDSVNPDSWKFRFPNLDSYKIDWLKQAGAFKETEWAEDPEAALFRVSNISVIEITGDSALVRKKFCGDITKSDGQKTAFLWQTLYYCQKLNGQWKITGFTGYLPYSVHPFDHPAQPAKRLPANTEQHKTAGPYSPVLIINPGELVVISGQAAIDPAGNIIGDTIENQAAYTLDNCKTILQRAGCRMEDVFKVNVFMKNMDEWTRFNAIYKKYFATPMPVRTTVQAGLLPDLLVEIEMWAVKK